MAEVTERTLQHVMKRARGSPDKTGITRRNALQQLIDATRSPSSSVKIYAAGNMAELFQDFPDLEEDAINSIYDLCEDQDSKVRIEGYRTLSLLSRAENKWIKRNADVLVQLLQSDEPNEVNVVRKALVEHLQMDPRVTLGVFCDQISPQQDQVMDEEEQAMRDRLRGLVLDFVTNEVKKDQWSKLAAPGSEAENVLISGLMSALPKAGDADTQIIVKDILLHLQSLNSHPSSAAELCQFVLAKAKDSRSNDLSTTEKIAPLTRSRPYLELLNTLFLERNLGNLEDLFSFYQPLIAKSVLQRLAPQDQLLIVLALTETVVTAKSRDQNQKLAKDILVRGHFCFEWLSTSDLSQEETRKACHSLLQCASDMVKAGWQMPGVVTNSIQLLSKVMQTKPGELKELHDLIRPLVLSKKPESPSIALPSPLTPGTNGIHPLPQRPASSYTSQRPKLDPVQVIAGPSSVGPSSAPASRKHPFNEEDSPRATKKAKKGGGSATAPQDSDAPSLLSRLRASSVGANGRTDKVDQKLQSGRAPQHLPSQGIGELSIKGAARLQNNSPAPPDPGNSAHDRSRQGSLMNRLDRNISSEPERSGRRKKRGSLR